MVPFALSARKRGPQPKSSPPDALLCYLLYLKVPSDAAVLAKTLGISETQFTGNLDRIRPILNAALHTKWPEMAPRPLDYDARLIFEAGLLVDNTTTECFRPKGRFGEVKHYFDGHHYVYGLKSEIAVTSARPHVMVAVSPHEPGSVSGYEIHKANYRNYLPYLRRTPEELHQAIDRGDDHPYWAAIGDKEYIGPAADTPNERRITQKKGFNLNQGEKKRNKDIKKERTPVECFLGRMIRKWPLFSTVYKIDHSKFDQDFENACLLTNEDITISNLTPEDGEFYKKFLDARVERFKNEEKKRKASSQNYTKNKKAKIDFYWVSD